MPQLEIYDADTIPVEYVPKESASPNMAERIVTVNGLERNWERMLAEQWPGEILWEYRLSKLTTFRIGGPARAVVLPATEEELKHIIVFLHTYKVDWVVMGRGSNVLVADRGFGGVAVVLGNKFSAINIVSESENGIAVRVAAGCSLARLVAWCVDRAIVGFEFAAGIPGSVGGAVVMNAGAWGHEIGELVAAVHLLSPEGELVVRERRELDFSYRALGRMDADIVVAATFLLKRGERDAIEADIRRINRQRRELQPQGVASAGSFFKNPPGQAAGFLIERAGLRGCRMGGAMVSCQHANFIVNTGSATAGDVLGLMRLVQERVFQDSGVRLEPEVRIVGHDVEGS